MTTSARVTTNGGVTLVATADRLVLRGRPVVSVPGMDDVVGRIIAAIGWARFVARFLDRVEFTHRALATLDGDDIGGHTFIRGGLRVAEMSLPNNDDDPILLACAVVHEAGHWALGLSGDAGEAAAQEACVLALGDAERVGIDCGAVRDAYGWQVRAVRRRGGLRHAAALLALRDAPMAPVLFAAQRSIGRRYEATP